MARVSYSVEIKNELIGRYKSMKQEGMKEADIAKQLAVAIPTLKRWAGEVSVIKVGKIDKADKPKKNVEMKTVMPKVDPKSLLSKWNISVEVKQNGKVKVIPTKVL